jgi:HEAT repeat protein
LLAARRTGYIKCLGHDVWGVRSAAAKALGAMGPEAVEAIPKLLEQIGDDSGLVRRAVVDALGKIEKDWANSAAARQAIPGLVNRLAKIDCKGAIEGLGAIGPAAAPAVPHLIRCLHSKKEMSSAVKEALDRIDPNWRDHNR